MSDEISDPNLISRIRPTVPAAHPAIAAAPTSNDVDPSRFKEIRQTGTQETSQDPSYLSQIGTGLAKDVVAPFVSAGEMALGNVRAREKYGAPPSIDPVSLAARGLNVVPPIHALAKRAQRWVEGPSSGLTEDITRVVPDLALLAASRSNAPMVERDVAGIVSRVFGTNAGRVATKKMISDLTSHIGSQNVQAAMNVINRMRAPQYLRDLFSRELGKEVRTRSVGMPARLAASAALGSTTGALVSPGQQGAGGAAGGAAAVGGPYSGPLAHAIKRHPYLAGIAGFGAGEHGYHGWSPTRAAAAYGLAALLSTLRGGSPMGLGALAAQIMNNPNVLDLMGNSQQPYLGTTEGANQKQYDLPFEPSPAPEPEPEPAPPAIGND